MSSYSRPKAVSSGHYHGRSDSDLDCKLLNDLNALAEESQVSLNSLANKASEILLDDQAVAFAAILAKPSDLKQQLLVGYSSRKPLFLTRPPQVAISQDLFTGSEDYYIFGDNELSAEAVAKYLDWSVNQVEHNDRLLKLKSIYAVKLKARGHSTGLLVVGFNKAINKNSRELIKINAAKGVIAILIDGLRAEQENYHNIRRLKDYSRKQATLDEAKDDFISMASHQLRTPLTSVKGYISMILDGDTGAISKEQQTMLNQAFASCQRMVYIISDLLNVSRLRTGKFIIDRSSVDLDYIVRDEIDQLKEIAKAHNVTINYNPPKLLPKLNLDETKIRQVIMNFIDNALYYTPAGGQITVSLANRSAAIELRVKDNGMGVPKSEQHHLFTKFYRATNARKARPDGTGLGLFMSKKIIIAQGGAVIFESAEGKGSTFGFIFPKSNNLLFKNA